MQYGIEPLTNYVGKKIDKGCDDQYVRHLLQIENYLMHGTLAISTKDFLENLKEEYPKDYKAIKEELGKNRFIEKREEKKWNLERKMREES